MQEIFCKFLFFDYIAENEDIFISADLYYFNYTNKPRVILKKRGGDKMNNNQEIATSVLKEIGGQENITSLAHCMTRLRFTLKDKSIVNVNQVKSLPGVLGYVDAGEQIQVVIGQNVSKVYAELCKMTGREQETAIKENLDKELLGKEPFSWKKLPGRLLDALSGCVTPVLPVVIVAAIFKMVASVFGPDMFGVISAEGDLYQILNMVGDAGFYFFPAFLGYSAAKKFGGTPILGMLMGTILIHPMMMDWANNGVSMTVYGIPFKTLTYNATMFPAILTSWAMSYIEKWIRKIVPEIFSALLVPVLTVVITLPISLCLLAPLGSMIGTGICNTVIAIGNNFGWLGTAIVGALWSIIVMTGMHPLIFVPIINMISEVGYDPVFSAGATASGWSVVGICIGMCLALKDKKERSLCAGYALTGFIGGITEPGIYGVALRYKKPFLALILGGFLGGLYCGITHVLAYSMCPVAGMLEISQYIGGSGMNFINGLIGCSLALVVSAVITYIFCREKKE